MHKAPQSYKVSGYVPPTAKNTSQKFTPYAEPRFSLKERWQGKDGQIREDGHKFGELCAKCNKAFGSHFDNHCFEKDYK